MPPSAGAGRQRGRRPPTRGHGGSRSPTSCCLRRTSISPASHGTHLISSPLLSSPPRVRCYHDFILLLLPQNRSVSWWGGGSPRLVLLDGGADQGRREEGGRMNGVVRSCSWASGRPRRRRAKASSGGDLEETHAWLPTDHQQVFSPFACSALVLP
jgi:hypothetical protein